MDLTPLARPWFERIASRTDRWAAEGMSLQLLQLRRLLREASHTEVGRRYDFDSLLHLPDDRLPAAYRDRLPTIGYEDIRNDVMRMVRGQRDVLWRGSCHDYAQSSGTSGGKSKYIPITPDSLRRNHYPGATHAMAAYVRSNPASRVFSGKGLILGGSFASGLDDLPRGVHAGDLSATLINRISPAVNLMRVPSKEIALMADWRKKLPLLVENVAHANVTNISGVPSWMLTVLKEVMAYCGAETLAEVWPNLEVFIHGGISFAPYREEFRKITDPAKMHFVETYNASEGFFAVQSNPADPSMLLLVDTGVYYEFEPLRFDGSEALCLGGDEVVVGKTYELVISSCNGLWRYRTGDTVTVTSTAPLKVRIAGRTKTFINAFGEELMENNAELAMERACARTGASVKNYTAGPVFAHDGQRGHHQWIIEWGSRPADVAGFARILDKELQDINSDYEAKRAGTIFLDPLEIVEAPHGLFEAWLEQSGNGKLGGQRKVPRLSNDRRILDQLLDIKCAGLSTRWTGLTLR